MNANRKYGGDRLCCRAGRFSPNSTLFVASVLLAAALLVAPAFAERGLQRALKRVAEGGGSRAIEAGGVCPLPDPAGDVPVCAALQSSQCVGGLPGDTCLPQVVFFDTTGNPVAELCQCFPQNGVCGPVHVLPDPVGPGFRLLCDPNCPNGVDACTIHFDGVNTGQNIMDSGSVPPGALVSCDCAPGGPAPCPLPVQPIIPICDQNQAGGQCQTGNAGDTCLPSILITNDTGGFIAELCDCYPPSTDGVCGPVTVDGSVGFPVFSCVEACPDPPGGNCEIHINGTASGLASMPVFDVPPNSAVTCECATVVQNNFCIYEITCAEGDCTNCEAAIAGACFDAACPGGTCSVLAGATASCGSAGATCCIEFGAFTCADPIGLPPCPPITNDCTCTPPQPGACCFGDGTCSVVLEADCPAPAIWQGPGTACGPIGACCDLATGECKLEHQICCNGVWHQGDCQPLQACCFQDGTCGMLDPQCCVDVGGLPLGAGSLCLGDLNQNGIDDACETQTICPLPAQPVLPICQQQQQGSCVAGGPNDLCLPSMLFIDAAGQLQAEICQCFIPGNDCGPIDVQPLPGTTEILLSCNGLCAIPTDDCLLHVGGVSTGLAQDIASNLPSGVPITCECAQSVPQLGACCFADGTCTEVPQADCPPPAVWHGVGSTCGPIGACCNLVTGECSLEHQICCDGVWHQGDCQPLQACCLQDGTCTMLDPLCCVDLGGTAQGANSACSSTGPEACCFQDGTCAMLDPLCCAERGGTSQGAGSLCLGDLNQNGIDDACETAAICPLPAQPVLPICQQQQQGACVAGGPNDLCLPSMLFIDAAGQLQAEICQCFIPGNDCGPIDVQPLPGTTEVVLTCQGLCPIPTDDCLLHVGGVSTGLAQDIASNLPSGAPITCECTQPPPQVCEPLDDGSGCTSVQCPPDACFGECIDGSYCDDPACCIDPLACQCYAPNSVVSINMCGDCFGECTADGAYCDSGAPGCCIGGNCQCYSPNSAISIKLCGNCFGECIDGAYCDPVGNPACAIIPNQPACYDLFSQVSIDLCQSKPPLVDTVCETKCATFDPTNGAWGITVCDCVPVEECHIVLLPGADPFCDGVCPPGTECVRNETVDPVGNVVVCCDCEPIEACCMPTMNVTCQQLPVSQCLAQGGTPQGLGSTCLGEQACCLPDATCTFVDALCCDDLGGTPGGPGSTCLGEGACCLDIDNGPFQFDTCIIADAFCCETMGGAFQGVGSVCDTVACCLNGLCQNLDVECCLASGGVPQAAGSACEGDNNGNGVDDACEPDLCPLPLPPVIPICQQQQPGACVAGGPQDLCLPFIVFIDAAGQVQAEGCQCFSPGDNCGPVDVQPLPGTTETQLSCQGVCPAPDDDCLIHIGGVSTGLSQVIAANMPAGQAISCECAVACLVPNPPLPEKKLATTCTSDADCTNLAVCVNGDCYVPKNKYISLRPGNAGSMVGLRVTMTSNALFPALVGQAWWVQPHVAADPPDIFRLGCSKHYQDWGTAPTVIHVGDQEITTQAVYEVQALTLGCDQTVPGNYSTPLVLPTVITWGDCVGSVVAGLYTPPDGVANLNDVFAAVLVFQGATSPNLVWVDVDGDVPNGAINIADVFKLVLAFQGGGYPYPGPLACQ